MLQQVWSAIYNSVMQTRIFIDLVLLHVFNKVYDLIRPTSLVLDFRLFASLRCVILRFL